jgi:uncharacterized protein (TIGR03067 family)
METDGVRAPAEEVRRLVWKFGGDSLILKGTLGDQREVPCTYQIDPGKSPREIDYSNLGAREPVRAIYQLDGDRLTICQRTKPGERPREFVTRAGSDLTLIVLKRVN